MNNDLMDKTLDFITKERDRFDMSQWVSVDPVRGANPRDEDGLCATKMCMAGAAMLISGEYRVDVFFDGEHKRVIGATIVNVETGMGEYSHAEVAGDLLGLHPDEARAIFFATAIKTPEAMRKYVTYLDEHPGAGTELYNHHVGFNEAIRALDIWGPGDLIDRNDWDDE